MASLKDEVVRDINLTLSSTANGLKAMTVGGAVSPENPYADPILPWLQVLTKAVGRLAEEIDVIRGETPT